MMTELKDVRHGRVLREKMRIAGERRRRRRARSTSATPTPGRSSGRCRRRRSTTSAARSRSPRAYRPALTRHDRYRILYRAAEIIRGRTEEISDLITAECGICKKDSLYEVGRACDVFVFAGNAALADDGQIFSCDLTPHGKKRKVYTLREPLLGVISAITPFNHPLNQVAHKVAPAIATNNRMVLKPTEKTPLSALLLADILYEAGLPPEMFSVVTGDPKEIADEMLTNPDVDLVTFTGGVRHRQVHRGESRLQAAGAGARRQRPADRDGGCRHRRGRGAGGDGLVQEFRAAVHGDQADAGPRERRRRLRRAPARQDESLDLRRSDGSGARHGNGDRRSRGAVVRDQGQRCGRPRREAAAWQRAPRRAVFADAASIRSRPTCRS